MRKHFRLFLTKPRNWRVLEPSKNQTRRKGFEEKMKFRRCRTNLHPTSPSRIQWTWANNPISFQSLEARLGLLKYMTLQEMSKKVIWMMISVLSLDQSPKGKDTTCSTVLKVRRRNNSQASKRREEERSSRNCFSHQTNNRRRARWTKWARIKIVQGQ